MPLSAMSTKNDLSDVTENTSVLRAEVLGAGLTSQYLRPCRGIYQKHSHIMLITSGEFQIKIGSLHVQAEAPAALILPPLEEVNIVLSAGCTGWLFGIAAKLVHDAVGTHPESEFLTPLGKQVILARDFQPNSPSTPDYDPLGAGSCAAALPIESLAQAIMSEHSSRNPGKELAFLAYARLLLLAIWRHSRITPYSPGLGGDHQILERFRRLVEVHFRSHISIGEYADMLGVTQSRLRRICQRNLNRGPLQLLHQRMMREAAGWLTNSGKSVVEIAQMLGFVDPAEFSHFFKRNSDLSPKDYRAKTQVKPSFMEQSNASMADWP